MESSRGSLRFDEFPTSMSDATPSKRSARNTPIGLRKRKTVRVSLPASLSRAGAQDSAVCVSLSSYHNVKEPPGVWHKVPHSRTFDGSKSSIKSQRQPQLSREILGACFASACGSRGSRLIPQDVRTTRASRSFKCRLGACQGRGRPSLLSDSCLIVAVRPHSCPNAPPLFHSLTAR
jgi:hypothetical protein